MTKQEFLEELRMRLAGLSSEERDAALVYYEEFFNDMSPENEAEVITKLGTPEEVAQTVLDGLYENMVPDVVFTSRQRKKVPFILWLLAGLIVFPATISLFATTGSAVIVVLIAVLVAFFSLFFLTVALFLTGGVLLYCGVLALAGSLAQALLWMGASAICLGLALVLFVPSIILTKSIFQKIFPKIKTVFVTLVNWVKGRFFREKVI